MEMGLCEICASVPAVTRCDNGLDLCVDCAIGAGYNYQVYDLPDEDDEDEEEEENENPGDRENWDED